MAKFTLPNYWKEISEAGGKVLNPQAIQLLDERDRAIEDRFHAIDTSPGGGVEGNLVEFLSGTAYFGATSGKADIYPSYNYSAPGLSEPVLVIVAIHTPIGEGIAYFNPNLGLTYGVSSGFKTNVTIAGTALSISNTTNAYFTVPWGFIDTIAACGVRAVPATCVDASSLAAFSVYKIV